MSRKVSGQDPALSIDFFTSGFFTYRSQLFAPFKPIGVNVVSFHDPVIDGQNMELTDRLQWTRRNGFSIFCSQALADSEVVNQFYSSRNLNGVVIPFVDTTQRLATFSPSAITSIIQKTTTEQGFVLTIGNLTYFADGAGADYSVWDGTNTYAWGLAAPTVLPSTSGMGFWQPDVSFPLGSSILDPNGDLETVTAILIPNGAFTSPSSATTTAFGGSLSGSWAPNAMFGSYEFVEGYQHSQQATAYAGGSTNIVMTFAQDVTVGNVVLLSVCATGLNSTPGVISVTDNLGNTYTQQAAGAGVYHGGGGQNYASSAWVYSAPVTTGGTCTVTVVMNVVQAQVLGHEVSGISDVASASASNYVVNGGSAFNSGTVSFSGTQFILSNITLDDAAGSANYPAGYTPGNAIIGGADCRDAYSGQTSVASPTWTLPLTSPPSYLALGLTVSFPITTLVTGYTPYLFLYDFNNAVPTGATIVGIQVTLPKFDSASGVVQDQVVSLVIGGSVVGTNKASATAWSNAGYATAIYGGPLDTWGLTPSAAQLNANGLSGFGVVVSAAITSIAGGSVIPQVGFNPPNQPTVTIFYQQSGGKSGPGISGNTEPIWPTNLGNSVNDGGITWTEYGPILMWLPATSYPTPAVILDPNGFLQLATSTASATPLWDMDTTYSAGQIVYYGGQYWIYINSTPTSGIVPSTLYTTATTTGGVTTVTPYWALTPSPVTTGLTAPNWNTTVTGTTDDASYIWTNIGQGTALAFIGYAYVYGYRTVYGHLTTCSPFSANTGAILGPVNATITSLSITDNVITFLGANNFLPGNIFQVQGLTSAVGQTINNQSFTVVSAVPSQTLSMTVTSNTIQITSNVLTVQVVNSLATGQTVTFTNVGTATFMNGVTVTVVSATSSQFTANFPHTPDYGPATDTGIVDVTGSYSANYPHADVSATADAGAALPLIASLSGLGTASSLCNATATITAVSVTADIVTITAANNFQPGIWVTITGLTGAAFLNDQQVQVIAVDQPIGTENTYFQVYFVNANYGSMASPISDSGLATFNAIEIYRTSDGGGSYLFDGAVTNPAPSLGIGTVWNFNDFVPDANLDILLVAPLAHQNDPPPNAPGSLITTMTGTILTYWQGRIWMAAGNYVYFDAGPDCTNGVPEQAWPPSNRFQYSGPVLGIEKTSDGGALLVYLADRLAVIQGGPETISFYSTDLLSNFGVSNPNALFRDSQTLGQFTTQSQYIELVNTTKDDIGNHIGDYLADNFDPTKVYTTLHRNGLDVGVFLSNGVDRILRFGSNISAWSVPAFPSFGAGALNSIETSAGVYTLMVASPTGGQSGGSGPFNPMVSASIAGSGVVWANPANVEVGNPASYATATFVAAASSQVLRVSAYPVTIPATAVIQGLTLTLLGKQNVSSNFTVTVKPTIAGGTSHTFTFGATNTSVILGNALDLWNIPAWAQPMSVGTISFDITAAYTGPTPGTTGIFSTFDQSAANNGVGNTASVGPVTPAASGEIALVIGQASSGAVATPSGWTVLDNSNAGGSSIGAYVQILPTAAPFTYSQNLGSPLTWDALMLLFSSTAASFTGAISQISITSNVVTVTCLNDFIVGTQAIILGLAGAAFLNGATLTILTQSPTQFTATFVHADYGPTADTGTATDVGIVQSVANTPGNVGADTLTLPGNVTAGNTVFVIVQGIDSGGFGAGHCDITSLAGSTITPTSWTILNSGSTSGNKPQACVAYQQNVTGGDAVTVTVQNSLVGCRWIVIEVAGGVDIPDPVMSISQAQLVVAFQNPGNYLYARDLKSWGDDGQYGQNNGTPYPLANIVLGSITLSQPGAKMFDLQHIVGYFDAVGTLNNGSASTPNIWILPNEVSGTTGGPGFAFLPEQFPEPPEGQNIPSQTIIARRWPCNMMNSKLYSQFMHHLQVKIQFEPENAPNTIKAIAFKEDQS